MSCLYTLVVVLQLACVTTMTLPATPPERRCLPSLLSTQAMRYLFEVMVENDENGTSGRGH